MYPFIELFQDFQLTVEQDRGVKDTVLLQTIDEGGGKRLIHSAALGYQDQSGNRIDRVP